MPKLASGVRCAVHVGAAHRGGLFGVVNLAEETEVPGQWAGLLPQLVFVSAAYDQDLDVGESLDQRGQRSHQHRHPFAGLVEPAKEQHRLSRPRVSVESSRSRERRHVDTVGDFDGVRTECLHLPAPR
jgi:hypothetical protein